MISWIKNNIKKTIAMLLIAVSSYLAGQTNLAGAVTEFVKELTNASQAER